MTRPKKDPMDVFMAYVVIKEDGCWEWSGALGGEGDYGIFTEYLGSGETCTHVAHRFLYENVVGSIPKGYHLDHSCENHMCVAPRHLTPRTPAEHKQRHKAMQTHCKNGHEFNEANTYINPRGQRECRPCRTAAMYRSKARNRGDDNDHLV